MLIVGLTGNVAAGKSTVADLWREVGVPVVSADSLSRQAVQPGSPALEEIVKLFGPEVLTPNGELDRPALRRIVFADPAFRFQLERIVHPVVRSLRDRWTERQRARGATFVVWEVPLLFETGMDAEVDVVVLVDSPVKVRQQRMVKDRGLSTEDAKSVMAAQMSATQKRKRANIVLDNDDSREELARRAADVLKQLRNWDDL